MKVMIVTYGSIHGKISRRMQDEYAKNNVECVVLALPAAIPDFELEGRPFRRLWDYSFLFNNREEIWTLGTSLAEQYHTPKSGITLDDTIAYYGIGMWDLIKQYGKNEAERLFAIKGRKAFLPIESIKQILLYEKPDVVQTTSDVRGELAATRAAKELGIFSYNIQDAPYMQDYPESDLLCLINEECLEKYIMDDVVPREKLVVTGQPWFESYALMDQNIERAMANKLFSMSADKPLLLWMTNELDRYVIDTFREICRIANKYPEWNVMVKLHPTANQEGELEKYTEKVPENMRIIKHYESSRLIKSADAVITQASTSGFEAQLMQKPLILLNTTGVPYKDLDYEKDGAALLIKELSCLEEAVVNCLINKELRMKLSLACKKCYSSPKASENIVREVEKLCMGVCRSTAYEKTSKEEKEK